MNFGFFAIRSMFSATERVSLSRHAFAAGVSVAHVSRRKSPFRSISMYNVFSLKNTNLFNFYSIERFAQYYGFFLIASTIENYILSMATTKTFLLFCEIGLLPILVRCGVCLFPSLLLKVLIISLFSRKWLQ